MNMDVPEADVASIRRQMSRNPRYRKLMLENTIQDFEAIKRRMLHEFNNHKVTQEIEAGASSENISGTLTKGNLFSFIGFMDGETPTNNIREVLEDLFIIGNIRVTQTSGRVWFDLPDRKEILFEIWEKTPLHWAPGRSWADGIETSLSGLAQYVYSPTGFRNDDASRSGTGLQTKNRLKSLKDTPNFGAKGTFQPKRYMREIVEKAGKELWHLRMKQYDGKGIIV